MSLFSKLTGKGDEAPKGSEQRQHQRHVGMGETVVMMNDGKPLGETYPLVDISEGGFCMGGYFGSLRSGQYFEFRFVGSSERGGGEADGFGTVIRTFGGDKVAVNFPPQPRLKKFLREYLP